ENEINALQALAVEQAPILVPALHQVSFVERDGLAEIVGAGAAQLIGRGQLRRGEGVLELENVDPDVRFLVPADEIAVHVQTSPARAARGFAHGVMQLPERLPQIFARLIAVAVRPEEAGKSLARVRVVPVQQQVAEQLFRAVRLKTLDLAGAIVKPEIAEELDSQHHSTSRFPDSTA